MDDLFRFADDLGPEKIVYLTEPTSALRAIVVIDNTAAGPAIGGIRMAPDVSVDECFRLARAMTLKNAAAGLPHGGGKSVIFGDPNMPLADKELLIRAMAEGMRHLESYIPGPDMGTDERCMAWIRAETGRAAGLPAEIGGIPLDEIGATGYGLVSAIEVAKDYAGVELEGARVVVQGFGSVGQHAARFLAEKGAKLVAASDSHGAIFADKGLDLMSLIAHKAKGGSVAEFADGEALERDKVIDIPCEIWIPAARPDVLNSDNIGRLATRIVAQGANIPATQEAEEELYRRGIINLPDFIANAGGVICAAVEVHGGSRAQAFEMIADRITANTRVVLEHSQKRGERPRVAAIQLAEDRVRKAMAYRRSFASQAPSLSDVRGVRVGMALSA